MLVLLLGGVCGGEGGEVGVDGEDAAGGFGPGGEFGGEVEGGG